MNASDKLAERLRNGADQLGRYDVPGMRNPLAALLDEAAAALEAEAKPPTAEPTIEMLKAGAAEWLKYGEREACYPLAQGFDKLTPEDAIRRSRLTHVYRAMLAAAPAAPADKAQEALKLIATASPGEHAFEYMRGIARAALRAAPAAPAPVPEADFGNIAKDAERYRWLRNENNDSAAAVVRDYGIDDPAELDAFIDAAIAASNKGGAA